MSLAKIRSALHGRAKRCWEGSVLLERRMTRRLRALPDFLVIGAQRCGTTSLHRYLEGHPQIAPAARKEVHYFDDNYRKGDLWYRTFFPCTRAMRRREARRGLRILTGEASPYYVFHPHAPKRVRETVPSAKLILLLRDPVDRAYSHYHHEVREGFEIVSTFEEAIEREPDRLSGERERMIEDETYRSFAHMHYSYLARGLYLDQVRNWRRFFPAEQMLILGSEEFFRETSAVYRRVLDFLDLPAREAGTFSRHNEAPKPPMDAQTRARLVRHFRPHNEELERFLGREFGWSR